MVHNKVYCPSCQTGQFRRGDGTVYHCGKCGGMFDDDPEDGGDYSDRNPAARLEREERRGEARRNGRRPS